MAWVGLPLALGVASCDRLTPPPLPLLEAPAAGLPPCVADDCSCGDFRDQALAQRVLEGFPGDPFRLDGDGNGRACEDLPAVAPPGDPPAPPLDNPHLGLGNPSQAAATNPHNFLLVRSGFVASYHRDRGHANWVSWQLAAPWLGDVERQDDFRPDAALPPGFYAVTPQDYRGSGYDRGHLLPSGDRTVSVPFNSATFLMSNIIPQAPENNRGPWQELEAYTRQLVRQEGREVYVIAGAYGTQGTLGEGRVTIPSRLWKIVVALEQPGAGITPGSLVIAVDMPNRDGIDPDWRTYETTVGAIAVATGYQFPLPD